jgi:hypothetical protein
MRSVKDKVMKRIAAILIGLASIAAGPKIVQNHTISTTGWASNGQAVIQPKDAMEILSLVQGTTVKVSDLPEVARLETLLHDIAYRAPPRPSKK